MTEPYKGHYNIKPVQGETFTSGSLRGEIREIRNRIEAAEPSLKAAETAYGLEVKAANIEAAERIVSSPWMNREAQTEFYLDLDPAGSNFPPRQTRH